MPFSVARISWDTNIKHYVHNGLFDNLSNIIKTQIPKTNRYCWTHEADSKYMGSEVANFIKVELELMKQTGE